MWPTVVDRHVQSIEHELGSQVVRNGPADDLPCVGVQHEGELKPALPGSDVSDVRSPQVVWSFWGEVALH